jgi:hypothetical protein
MNWYELTIKDVLGLLLVAVLLAVFAYTAVEYALFRGRTNFGFGPEWECSYPGKGDPICIKRPASTESRKLKLR